MVSINPEVELGLSDDGIIRDVVSLNDDSDIHLSDLELEGMTIEKGTNYC